MVARNFRTGLTLEQERQLPKQHDEHVADWYGHRHFMPLEADCRPSECELCEHLTCAARGVGDVPDDPTKSELVADFARDHDITVVEIRMSKPEPDDLVGLPTFVVPRTCAELTMSSTGQDVLNALTGHDPNQHDAHVEAWMIDGYDPDAEYSAWLRSYGAR